MKRRYFVTGQLGVAMLPFVGGITIPHQITFNFGKKGSYIETGLGGTFWTGKSNSSGFTETINSYNISPIIGYRFQSRKGFLLRAYFNPIINLYGGPFIGNYPIVPYFGVSLGYTC